MESPPDSRPIISTVVRVRPLRSRSLVRSTFDVDVSIRANI